MQEDFLHYIWKHKKIPFNNLATTSGDNIVVVNVGQHNFNSGPDFFNATLRIGEQLWAGNIEIHVKSSDWFLHNHEKDSAYNNVILHIVWEEDVEVFRRDNTAIPTLELKKYLEDSVLDNYKKLFSKSNKWINCENDFASINRFTLTNWLERLYFERLERKSETIETLLKKSKNDWEAVLFKMLTRNFGLKVNGESFFSVANSVDFSIIRKIQSKPQTLEALLFGQAGLLDQNIEDAYHSNLVAEYEFLKQKFNIQRKQVLPVQFFRLRPLNFPTIRLSQLANLYHTHQNLFSKLMELKTRDDFYSFFRVSTSVFWKTHYTFQKESKAVAKMLSKSFVDLLLINTILPLKFSYAKEKGEEVGSEIIKIISEIASEKNSIIDAFNKMNNISKSALHSQALIQLKTEYCNKNRCLQCAIGHSLINNK